MIHQGSVELEPSYQRDVVWTVTKMMGLIQSFFLVSLPMPVSLSTLPSSLPFTCERSRWS